MANGIPAVRRIQKFRNGGDYSFLDRALDTPLGPGSPNTLRDVPAMARSLGPGFLELARYQPTGVGDVAEERLVDGSDVGYYRMARFSA